MTAEMWAAIGAAATASGAIAAAVTGLLTSRLHARARARETAGTVETTEASQLWQVMQGELTRLSQENVRRGNELGTLRREQNRLQSRIRGLEETQLDQADELRRKDDEIHRLGEEIADLREQLAQRDERIANLEAEREKLVVRVGELEAELQERRDIAAAHAAAGGGSQ